MAERITQQASEILTQDGNARITQQPTEIIVAGSTVRESQTSNEVIVAGALVRESNLVVELILRTENAISQLAIEVITGRSNEVSQVALEVLIQDFIDPYTVLHCDDVTVYTTDPNCVVPVYASEDGVSPTYRSE